MVHSLLVVDFTDAESYSHYDIWNQQLGKLDIRSILTVFRITIKYCCCQREEEGMRVCLSFFQSLQGHCHDPRHHQRSEFAFVVAESFVLWQCVGTILAGKKGSAGEGRVAQKEQEQIIPPNIGSIWLSDSSGRSSLILPPTQSTSHKWSVPGEVKVKFKSCRKTKVSRSNTSRRRGEPFNIVQIPIYRLMLYPERGKRMQRFPEKIKALKEIPPYFYKTITIQKWRKTIFGNIFSFSEMQMVLVPSLFDIYHYMFS